MKRVLIGIAVVIVAFFGTVALTATPLAGEVAKLHTVDADGQWQVTPLWIVDEGGHPYVRAGQSETGWLKRLAANPKARLERAGEVVPVRVVLDEAARAVIDQRMAEAYGWANSVQFILGDPKASVPLRLDVIDESS